mmetsp:Transcript_5037/g.5914  ORF Transcript_5037/g.5914 Transcript_5037/m.5914 type:complete len:203 (-) Transcript_5037:297-905(-)
MAVSSSTGTIHVFNLLSTTDELESNSATGGIHKKHSSRANVNASQSSNANTNNRSGESSTSIGSSQTPNTANVRKKSSLYNFLPSGALDAIHFERRRLVAGMLPESISDFVEPSRSFAHAKISTTNPDVVTICAISEGYLRVVSSDGRFYQYCIQRGECQLVFEMPLLSGDLTSQDPNESQGYTRLFRYQEEISTDKEKVDA